ncbi:MAG: response regulator [Deltaproteobacteria bacterium]
MRRFENKVPRLLIVEDNPGDADYIVSLLEEDAPGNELPIFRAETMKAAHAVLADEAVDAIILDLRLPDCEGIECVRAIRSVATNTPILVLTALEDEALALTCLSEGAQDYISKNDVGIENLTRALGFAMARMGESSARKREERVRSLMGSLVGSTADAILSTSVDGIVTSWNLAAESFFDIPSATAVGKPIEELASERAEVVGLREVAAAAQRLNGSTVVKDVIQIARRSEEITASVAVTPLRDEHGEVHGRTIVCRDITELERRGREVRRRNAELVDREQRMRALTKRLNEIREEEQTRLSREVHDHLGQMLTAIKMDLKWIERHLHGSKIPSEVDVRLHETSALTDEMAVAVRGIAARLRPATLDSFGLAAAVRDEARRFESRARTRVSLEVSDLGRPRSEIETELFRILQELLTNVARHAVAQNVWVALKRRDDELELVVTDDGLGIDEAIIDSPRSLGLLGVRERAEGLGGSASIDRSQPTGTRVQVTVPWQDRS